MNDLLKWILITFAAFAVLWVGSEAAGLHLFVLQASVLRFLQTAGLVFILFSGGAAAVEVARYYHNKNRILKEEESSPQTLSLDEERLESLLQQVVSEALETSRTDRNDGQS